MLNINIYNIYCS